MSGRRDSTCQKHELPKSLQGTEDADFVWNMITDRFPNAAPLLCEMETVIERAEDLLQQLKAPCREIETSTSFCTQDSEESTTLMISARGSLSTDNDNTEESGTINKSTAEIQVSESSIEEDTDLIADSQNSVPKEQYTGSQSSDTSMMDDFKAEKKSNVRLASANAETNTDQLMKEARSLEGWHKIVDSAMRGSITGHQFLNPVNYGKHKVANLAVKEHEESCIILHRQETGNSVGDSTMEIDTRQNMKTNRIAEPVDDAVNISLKGNGDESSLAMNKQRTPLNVLEEYAKRCEIPIEYEHVTDALHRYKSNVYVIRANLVGFAATCRGISEHTTKNNLAAKILQMIANQQMKDEKLGALKELTKTEIIEIINFGTDGLRETAQKKLYQLCLEQDVPVPKYSVEKMKTYQGFTYIATCNALGYTCDGHGLRDCVAKKVAAAELHHRYCEDRKIGEKVNYYIFL